MGQCPSAIRTESRAIRVGVDGDRGDSHLVEGALATGDPLRFAISTLRKGFGVWA